MTEVSLSIVLVKYVFLFVLSSLYRVVTLIKKIVICDKKYKQL